MEGFAQALPFFFQRVHHHQLMLGTGVFLGRSSYHSDSQPTLPLYINSINNRLSDRRDDGEAERVTVQGGEYI